MRQLKAFMKAKKGVCSKKCECLTINMWRCADLQNGEEFCGCGENGTSLPNKFKVRENSENLFLTSFFNEDVEQDNTISVETDEETADTRTVIGEFLFIEDTRALWCGVREDLDGIAVGNLLGRYDEGNTGVGHFTPEAMAQFNAFINNPTEEQAQILHDWLEDRASDEYDPPHYPIVIFTLLSYQEIMALTDSPVRVEALNKAPVEYFNKFTEEGHMVRDYQNHLEDDTRVSWNNVTQKWEFGR